MTDKTTIPAGSITVGMVTAGAEEVANYYDDGNDLRHREVARFVFQAMQRAAPSPAPAAPSAAQWMPIETAPKDRLLLLACADWPHSTVLGKPVPVKVGGWHDHRGHWEIFGASWKPTHWMPLPAAPGAQPAQPEAEERGVSEESDPNGPPSIPETLEMIEVLCTSPKVRALHIATTADVLDGLPALRAALSAARASAPEVVEALKKCADGFAALTKLLTGGPIYEGGKRVGMEALAVHSRAGEECARAALRSAGEG